MAANMFIGFIRILIMMASTFYLYIVSRLTLRIRSVFMTLFLTAHWIYRDSPESLLTNLCPGALWADILMLLATSLLHVS